MSREGDQSNQHTATYAAGCVADEALNCAYTCWTYDILINSIGVRCSVSLAPPGFMIVDRRKKSGAWERPWSANFVA